MRETAQSKSGFIVRSLARHRFADHYEPGVAGGVSGRSAFSGCVSPGSMIDAGHFRLAGNSLVSEPHKIRPPNRNSAEKHRFPVPKHVSSLMRDANCFRPICNRATGTLGNRHSRRGRFYAQNADPFTLSMAPICPRGLACHQQLRSKEPCRGKTQSACPHQH